MALTLEAADPGTGRPDYVDLGLAAALQVAKISIGFWVRRNGNPVTNAYGLHYIANGGWGIAFNINVVDDFSGEAGSGDQYVSGAGEIPNLTWTHVFFTFDNTVNPFFIGYINGVAVALAADTVKALDYTGAINCEIGGDSNNAAASITGLIADVRVYNRVLTPNEIRDIYQCHGSDRIINGLIYQAKLNEFTSGTVINFASGKVVKDNSVSRIDGIGLNFIGIVFGPIYAVQPIKTKRRHL